MKLSDQRRPWRHLWMLGVSGYCFKCGVQFGSLQAAAPCPSPPSELEAHIRSVEVVAALSNTRRPEGERDA